MTSSAKPAKDQSPKLLEILKQFWGYDSFRPLQQEAIDCAQARQDSVVVLPTGGGKSLCYQLPATIADNVAVVVSPLISLMKDQVDSLNANGIAAASINSSMTDAEKRSVANRVENGELKLLYMAPERLVQPRTIGFLKRMGVSFFAIDEAHCISSWGHDFRPEFRQLGSLKNEFPDASVHAFTATATERVRRDIAVQLNLTDANTLVGSFDRPNLLYRVHQRGNTLAQLREVIDRYPGQPGIVYCISRREVNDTAATLCSIGLRAKPYHAGLTSDERTTNQDDFINDRTDIIVATVAFGMGIDKSNVRYVIHTGMPKSLEAYQQESGRAGRDGLMSECTLLYSGGDLMIWKRMMDDPQSGQELLDAMYSYCTRTICRHKMLVEYFGQDYTKPSCEACDVCLDEMDAIADPLITAQKIISCVVRVNQRFGAGHVAKVLTGSAAARILELGHDKLSTYGLLANHKAATVVDWIEQLVGQRFLAKTGEYNIVTVTESGRNLLRGEVTPSLVQSRTAQQSSGAADEWVGVDRELFDALQQLRRDVATESNMPPFVIFHDVSLREMARRRPSSIDGFGTIPGVGEKKLADFGSRFSEFIAAHCAQHELETDVNSAVDPGRMIKQQKVNVAKSKAFDLFAQELQVEDVAPQIDRALSTTFQYLADFIAENNITDPSPWVDAAKAKAIRDAINQVGAVEKLSPIKEVLGDDFEYDQIRIVLTCVKVETGFFADHSKLG